MARALSDRTSFAAPFALGTAAGVMQGAPNAGACAGAWRRRRAPLERTAETRSSAMAVQAGALQGRGFGQMRIPRRLRSREQMQIPVLTGRRRHRFRLCRAYERVISCYLG